MEVCFAKRILELATEAAKELGLVPECWAEEFRPRRIGRPPGSGLHAADAPLVGVELARHTNVSLICAARVVAPRAEGSATLAWKAKRLAQRARALAALQHQSEQPNFAQ